MELLNQLDGFDVLGEEYGLLAYTRYSFTFFVCAIINHSCITPARSHYSHYCNTIARLLRHI